MTGRSGGKGKMRKRTAALAVMLAALLTLSGCARAADGKKMTLDFPAGRAEGTFTGTVEGLGRTGTGTFLSAGGWTYEGRVEKGVPVSGRVSGLPAQVTLAGTSYTGVYTGETAGGLPEGQGTFVSDGGVTFSGSFSGGAAADGTAAALPLTAELAGAAWAGLYAGEIRQGAPEGTGRFEAADGPACEGTFSAGTPEQGRAEDLPFTLEYGGAAYAGAYTGGLAAGLPEGSGAFQGASAEGAALVYDGDWAAGGLSGRGTLTAERLGVLWDGAVRIGAFAGDTVSGVPDGEGTFRAKNDANVTFTYEGGWKDGLFDGQGVLAFDADNYYTRRGTFAAGLFTPTFVEALETFGTYEPRFTLTDAQKEFLARYPEVTDPAADHGNFDASAYRNLYNNSMFFQQFMDDPESYEEDWLRLSSWRVIEARTGTYFDNGVALTFLTAANDAYTTVCRIYVAGLLDETALVRGARINAYVIPLGVSSFTNTLGETVPCGILLAGDIKIR